ncbi:hypothetical protein EB001_20140 [bacterium]|nr:hypothetical protein [bacterium]
MSSFKKIALAVSAALVGSLFMVAPARAGVPTVAVSVNTVADNDANTIAGAAVATVPADNKVEAADAVKFALTNIDAGTTVLVSTVKATVVPALHTVTIPVTSKSGSNSLSIAVGTGTTADFYVYTTTTEVGTVTIVNGANTLTYYVKGTAGGAYNLDATVKSDVSTASIVENTVKVTDIFGNVVGGITPTVTVIGATIEVAATASDATTGISKFSTKYAATAGQAAVSIALPGVITDVDGLDAAKKSTVKFVTVSDLASEVTNLKAVAAKAAEELAAEKAAHAKTKAELAQALGSVDLVTKTAATTKAALEADLAKANADLKSLQKKYAALLKKKK